MIKNLKAKIKLLNFWIFIFHIYIQIIIKQTISSIKLTDPIDLPQDLHSADAASERAGGSAGAGFKPAGVLDFSSASEDEDPCCSRPRPSEAHTGEEGGAVSACFDNMGLYSLLQRQMAQRERQDSDEDSSSQSQDEDYCEKPTMIKGQTSKTRDLYVESKERLEGVIEGKRQKKIAHLELLPTSLHKHNKDRMTASKNRFHKRVKYAEKRSEDDIENFNSSEDEVPQEGMRCMKGPSPQDNKSADRWSSGRDNSTKQSLGIKSRNSQQTSGSNKTPSRDGKNTGALDTLLGRTNNFNYLLGIILYI